MGSFKGFDIKKGLKYLLVGVVTGFANGMFGSGGGTIVVPAMVLLLGIEEHKAHATAIAVILPLTLFSAFFYLQGRFIDWSLAWKTMAGGLVGGFIGAALLKRCPVNILRKIFGGFIILGAIRMIIG